MKRLDRETPRDQRTPDFMTLLGQLAGDPEGKMRRPPAAAQRTMSACNDENLAAEQLVPILEQDPLLVQGVLARSNSAYYNRSGRPCLVLTEAITRLGRRSVQNVVLQQALGGLVFSPGGPWQDMVGQVWSHMVRTGPVARELAPLFGVDPEQAFALGLLHDVGKIAVFERIARLRSANRGHFDVAKPALTRALQILHEPLGGLCAIGWGFGAEAAAAIAAHHRDPAPVEGKTESEVVFLAERIDLALQRTERDAPLDLELLWRTGQLTADREVAQSVIAGITQIQGAPIRDS